MTFWNSFVSMNFKVPAYSFSLYYFCRERNGRKEMLYKLIGSKCFQGRTLIYFLFCRSCRLYNPNSYRCCYNINKLILNNSQKATEIGEVCCVLIICFIIIWYTILFSDIHCILKSAEKLPKAEWLLSFVMYSIGLGNWVYQVPVQFTLYSDSNWM